MRRLLKLYQWAESLTECGQMNEVGVGMIHKLREVIREAYKDGFKDGSKRQTAVQTRRGVSGCGVRR